MRLSKIAGGTMRLRAGASSCGLFTFSESRFRSYGVESKPLNIAVGQDRELIRTIAGEKVHLVIINSTRRQAFHQLPPANAVPEMAVGEEVEWFVDVAETVIGTIGFDARIKGWNYAILTRDARGEFRISEQHGNFPTRHAARIAMLRRMVETEAAEASRLAAAIT
jgi:hypothetical protein